MFAIDIQNVQAIERAHLEFEDNTIVEFTGDNSNGKSVISKVIEKTTSGDLRNRDVRDALIRDGCNQGICIFTHDYKRLGIVMGRELKESQIIYQSDYRDETTTVIRPLSDTEGSNALIRAWGFRTYADGDICLQLSPTFGAIPFITTNGKVNGDIVDDITVDKIAEEFLGTFKSITFPLFKDKIAKLKQNKETYESLLANLETYDWRVYEDIHKRMNDLYNILKDVQPFDDIQDIPIPPLDIIPAGEHHIAGIPIVEFYDYCPVITDIQSELEDYIKISNGVCPTCGKALFN